MHLAQPACVNLLRQQRQGYIVMVTKCWRACMHRTTMMLTSNASVACCAIPAKMLLAAHLFLLAAERATVPVGAAHKVLGTACLNACLDADILYGAALHAIACDRTDARGSGAFTCCFSVSGSPRPDCTLYIAKYIAMYIVHCKIHCAAGYSSPRFQT